LHLSLVLVLYTITKFIASSLRNLSLKFPDAIFSPIPYLCRRTRLFLSMLGNLFTSWHTLQNISSN
jgi:hypothetical protein